MLVLTLGVGESRYALDVRRVVEVLPRIPLRPVPHADAHLAGLFNHGGAVVPVVDLGLLLGGEACALRLSTRIILVEYPGRDGRAVRLGLIAERVTELRESPEVADAGGGAARAPYLGPMVILSDGLFQMLRVERILPEGSEAILELSTGGA
jgi:chemotaxis-related protein WspB